MSNTQQILQQTLSNWQNWHTSELTFAAQPQVLYEILGGKTNRSFLVASGSSKAVVRVNAPNTLSLGIDRNREQLILSVLQPTGVAPKVLFNNRQVLVTIYCEGLHWSTEDLKVDRNRQVINQVLERIQSVSVTDLEPRNYVDYCSAYIEQLDNNHISSPIVEAILSAALYIDTSEWTAVICHHDLIPENIILSADGPIVLDWEYAALGHPALDYMRLYQGDLTSTNLTYDRKSIEQLEIIRRAMDDLWLLVQS